MGPPRAPKNHPNGEALRRRAAGEKKNLLLILK
jgi:hypothetical protein